MGAIMSDGNGWAQWQRHVLGEVQRLSKVYDDLHHFVHNQQDRITSLTTEFSMCRHQIQNLTEQISTLIRKREEEVKEHLSLLRERQEADRRAKSRIVAMFIIALISTATSIAVAFVK